MCNQPLLHHRKAPQFAVFSSCFVCFQAQTCSALTSTFATPPSFREGVRIGSSVRLWQCWSWMIAAWALFGLTCSFCAAVSQLHHSERSLSHCEYSFRTVSMMSKVTYRPKLSEPRCESNSRGVREGGLFLSRGIRTSGKTMTSVKCALHMFFFVVALPLRVVTVPLRACCFLIRVSTFVFQLRCVEVVSHRLLVRRRSWCPVVVCAALVTLGF